MLPFYRQGLLLKPALDGLWFGRALALILIMMLLAASPYQALSQANSTRPGSGLMPAAIAPPLLLRDTTKEYALGRYWDVLALPQDSLRGLSFARLRTPAWAARFRRSQQDVPSYANWQGEVWLRGTVINQAASGTAWLLRVQVPASDSVTVYVVDGGGQVRQFSTGPAVAYAKTHAEPDRRFNFRLPLPQGQPVTLYVRTAGGLLNLSICERAVLQHASYWETFSLAAFMGALLMLALYNAFLFFSIREISYLYYVLYVVTFCALMVHMKDLLTIWFFPLLQPRASGLLYLVLVGSNVLFGCLMARSFLETRRRAPRLDWLLRTMVVLAPLPLVAGLLLPMRVANMVSLVLPLASSLSLIVVGMAVLRTGYRPARYYMAGWGVVILSIVAFILAQFNILPANGWTMNSSSMAWGLEMVFLSLGLASRVNLARRAQQQARETAMVRLREKEEVQRVASQQLQARAAELERSNQQLQASLATTDQLQTMDRLKTNFFTNISHEFRTPLTLIMGPAEEIATANPDPATRRAGGLIARNAARLLGLINQLLDLSKLDAGAMHLAPTRGDIAALGRQLAGTFASLAELRGIHFHTQGPGRLPWVFDAGKLETVLTNLLSNAMRFVPAGGEITLSWNEVPATATAPALVELAVHDTGPGIAPAELPWLFDRFYQGTSSAAPGTPRGTGVGLTLVKELTELHGGSVTVRSGRGEGTTFTVHLPIGLVAGPSEPNAAPAAAVVPDDEVLFQLAEATATPEPNPEADLVLFIEDNDDVREFIRSSLAPAGYRLLEAANGLLGVEAALEHVPDLIISDVMMPGLDGHGVVRQLKVHPATSHVPIVLLTAKSTADDRLEGLEIGADAYLNKPFAARELRAQVRNLLALRNRNREHARAEQQVARVPAHALPEGVAPEAAPVAAPLRGLDQQFLEKVAAAVAENLGESEFDVDQLSDAVALSRTQLQRKLRALTGQSPAEYVRLARLQRALELLRARAGTVAEVGYEVGFSSPAHFSTVFSRQFGYPPSEVGKQ